MQAIAGEKPMKESCNLVKNSNGPGFCELVCKDTPKDTLLLEFELLSFILQWGNPVPQNPISQVEI